MPNSACAILPHFNQYNHIILQGQWQLNFKTLPKAPFVQGLVESWRKKLESQATSKGSQPLKKLGKISAKGDVYAILKCEGQVKRTALAKGHQNPVWKEDIAFKSVQITSELQVQCYS